MSSIGPSFSRTIWRLSYPGHKDENVYIFCCLWQERLGKYGISGPINPTQKGVTTTATVQHIYPVFLSRVFAFFEVCTVFEEKGMMYNVHHSFVHIAHTILQRDRSDQ